MRTIKFRQYDPARKRMDYCCETLTIWNGVLVAEGDHIPMQFTGLKDKNGVEIYEGDILSDGRSVQWGDGSWVTVRKKLEYGYQLASGIAREVEVIGNIHESPEASK